MTPEEFSEHCIYFRWGGFRFSLSGRGPILAWVAALTAIGTGLSWHKLLALL
jgi:hypothetical protein